MFKTQLLLDAKTATATSATIGGLRYLYKTFVLYGATAFTGSAKVYGAYLTTNSAYWVELGILSNGSKLAVNEPWTYLRAKITTHTAGTLYVAVMMRD